MLELEFVPKWLFKRIIFIPNDSTESYKLKQILDNQKTYIL